jgi:hypothetical protein
MNSTFYGFIKSIMKKNTGKRNFLGVGVFKKSKDEARHMKNQKINLKTEVQVMRTKLMTVLTAVTLCVALLSNPKAILAEDSEETLNHRVSLRERIDTNGDGTINDDEKAAWKEHTLERFDHNNDGRLDKNERRHARRGLDRAEDRRDRRENRWDRREDVRDHQRDRRQYRRPVSHRGGGSSRRR